MKQGVELDDEMRRRAFLTTTATGLAAILAEPAVPMPAAIDDPILTLSKHLTTLRTVDGHLGATKILGASEWLADRLWRLLRSTPDNSGTRTQLARLAAEAGELAGWAAFETGSPGEALRNYERSIQAARIAGHRDLIAYIAEFRSMVLWSGLNRVDEALRFIDTISLDGVSPHMLVFVHARRGRMLAHAGKDKSAHAAFDLAHNAADRATAAGPAPWVDPAAQGGASSWGTHETVEVRRGYALGALGIGDESYVLLHAGLLRQPKHLRRGAGALHLGLARAALHAHAPDVAAQHVVDAHRILLPTSPRHHRGVMMAAKQLQERHPDVPAVRDLTELLHPNPRFQLCETSRHGWRIHETSCRYARRGHARPFVAAQRLAPEEAARLARAKGHEVCAICMPS